MKLTWYGHACFLLETGDARWLIDPFMTGNPTFESLGTSVEVATSGVTHIALTHGHDDHIGDTVSIAQATGATVIANFELANYLAGKGLTALEFMNPGGELDLGAFRLAMTNANHSSSTVVDGTPIYLGQPAGFVVLPAKADAPSVYHMGDTSVIPDFAIVQALYAPRVGLVPIGDRFTMGAKAAAYACKTYFSFDTIVPCHYGTFPIIDATPDAFIAEMGGASVTVPPVGRAIDL